MKKQFSYRLAALLTCTALASGVLIGCGGGGSSTAGNTDAIISGVAAVGAPLANATIVVKDANNESVTATADANGSYTANVSGKTAPFMIKATGVVAGVSTSYYSALETAPKSGETLTANVTPLTHAIVAQSSSGDPATVFADVKANKAGIDATKVQAAKAKLLAALNDYIVALGGTANADPVTTKFNANSSDALDKVLDLIKINTQVTTTNGTTTANVSLTANGGATTTVTQADTAATAVGKKPTPPTTEEKELPISSIQTAINGMNAALVSSTAYGANGANFAAWLDDNLLDQGRDKTAFVTSLTSALGSSTSNIKWGAKLETPLIERCDASAKICWLSLTMNKGNGSYEKFSSAAKYNAMSGKWLVYGDRRAFEYDLNWVAIKNNTGTYSFGINLYIPFNNEQTLNSAKLSVSYDSGATSSSSDDLAFGRPAATCPANGGGNNFLVTSGDCGSNFVSLSDAKIAQINNAITAGTFRYKIVLSSIGAAASPASGSNTQEWTRLPAAVLGLTSTTKENYASSFPSITTNHIGTSSVAFNAPTRVENVEIRVFTNNVLTGTTNFGGSSVVSLNGVVTVARANSDCKANSGSTSACDSSYGNGGVITWVHISTKDAQGRSFWAGYGNYGGSGTASPSAPTVL
jgi:hypothetical protein